jgi:hypothetical protein
MGDKLLLQHLRETLDDRAEAGIGGKKVPSGKRRRLVEDIMGIERRTQLPLQPLNRLAIT